MSARKTDSFKLGLFVLLGTGLVLFTLVVLGSGNLFKKSLLVETYLDESVNGLEVGSPVKYRGVRVGFVKEVGFTWNIYPTRQGKEEFRYVRVVCSLDLNKYANLDAASLGRQLQEQVIKGLRMRPVSQGLTGQLFLGMDYVDPERNPPLDFSWKPEHLYIPSAPSMLSQVESAVASISNTLSGITKGEVEGLIHDFRGVAQSIDDFLRRTDAKQLGERLSANLAETEKIFRRINEILAAPEVKRLIPEATRTVAGVRRIVESSGDDVAATVKDLRSMADNFNVVGKSVRQVVDDPAFQSNMKRLPKMIENVNEASEELRMAASRLHDVMGRTNEVVAGQQGNVEDIMTNLRQLMENLRELSEEMKRYPSGAIFGAPPVKPNPEKE